MPPKTKTITKNQRKIGEEQLLKKMEIKSCMTKFIQAMSLYCTEDNISCLDERHMIILVNLHIQKSQSSGSLCLVKAFLYKDEVFPSPLIQICLQFKGMLNVDWTSRLWCFETINSILLLMSVLYLLIIYNLILTVGSLASTIFKFYN